MSHSFMINDEWPPGDYIYRTEPIMVMNASSAYPTYVPGRTYVTDGRGNYTQDWVPVPQYITYGSGGTIANDQRYSEYMAARQREDEYHERVQRMYHERVQRMYREQAEAKAKAEQLLLDWMTPAQRKMWAKNGYFHVRGNKRNKYQICGNSITGNVYQLNKWDTRVACFCASVPGVPAADTWLAQALMLKADEDKFRRIANRYAM